MIKIKTAELRKFITYSLEVPDSRLLPIYGYVKMVCSPDRSYVIKHSGHKFLVYDIDVDVKKEHVLMIETKPLLGFVKFSRSEEMSIKQQGVNIIIDDGEKKISCQTTSDIYPIIINNKDSEKIEIHSEVISSLVTAKTHVLNSSEKVMRSWMSFVHIRKISDRYYVIGTRGEVTYFKGFKEKMPEVSLDADVISCISDFASVTHSSVEGYDYFETPGVLYGFIKPETRCSESVDNVLKNFKSENSFEVATRPILDFCEMSAVINDTSVPSEIKVSGGDPKHIELSFEDMSDNVKANEQIKTSNKTFVFDHCLFLSRNLLTVLKGAKSTNVKISYAHKNFIVTTDEEDYIGAAMELG